MRKLICFFELMKIALDAFKVGLEPAIEEARPMLNFKSFRSASSVLAGIELMHMIRKGQFETDGTQAMSFADQFSAMAGVVRAV